MMRRHPFAWRLSACALLTGLTLAAQALRADAALAATLALFLLLSADSAIRGWSLSCLLFFLPWSPLLKLTPDGHSAYTLALILACAVRFGQSAFQLRTKCLFFALPLLALALLACLVGRYAPDATLCIFFLMLVFSPLLAKEARESGGFARMTVFFTVGIVAAALGARCLEGLPALEEYIVLNREGALIRRSGFYGDPNFYAAQISAAFAGALLLAEKDKGWFALLLPPLLFCGMLSLSKSFVLTLALVLLLWAVSPAFRPVRWKRRLALAALLGVPLILFLINDGADALRQRFAAGGLQDFTTGRSAYWRDYVRAIFSDPRLLLLGRGLNPENLRGWGSHSTPLQAIYQFGLPGGVLLASWLASLYGEVPGPRRADRRWPGVVFLVGAFLPWLALDLLFFDDFFLVAIYACVGLRGLCAREDERE